MIGSQISHYRLLELLGEGSFGVVYRGAHVHDEELQVAVKVLRPEITRDERFLKNLKRECRALAKLLHPNIVGFREMAYGEEQIAIVLELLEGRDLEALLQEGPQPVESVRQILGQGLEGLSCAHQQSMIHRDIKPANLFLTTEGRVKIMDFGLARAQDGSLGSKSTQGARGTLDYMAMETYDAGVVPRSDIYALGLVAWELLAGQSACQGETMMQKIGWHMGVGAADIRTLRPEVPAALAELIGRMTARELSERPDSEQALKLLQSPAQAASDERASTPEETSLGTLPHSGETEPGTLGAQPRAPTGPRTVQFSGSLPPGVIPAATQEASTQPESPSEPPPAQTRSSAAVEYTPTPTVMAPPELLGLPPDPPSTHASPHTEAAPTPPGAGSSSRWKVLLLLLLVLAGVAALMSGGDEESSTPQSRAEAESKEKSPEQQERERREQEQLEQQRMEQERLEQEKAEAEAQAQRERERAQQKASAWGVSLTEARVDDSQALKRLLAGPGASLQWLDIYGQLQAEAIGPYVFLDLQVSSGYEGFTLRGILTDIDAKGFGFQGSFSTQVSHIAGGQNCQRGLGNYRFVVYPGAPMWRLVQMDNPCDGVVDYLDLHWTP